jgi:hypothetical protein
MSVPVPMDTSSDAAIAEQFAFILYRKYCAARDPTPSKTLAHFSWRLAGELIGDFSARQRMGRPPHPLTSLHTHQLWSGSTELHCDVCYSRVGGVETGHKTRWHCSCGVAVCHTNPACFPAHLKKARASAAPAPTPAA